MDRTVCDCPKHRGDCVGLTPAVYRAVLEDSAGPITRSRYSDGSHSCRVIDLDWLIAVSSSAVPKNSVEVPSPALHRSSIRYRARGVDSSGYCHGGGVGPQVNAHGRVPIRVGPVSKLSDVVPAPAVDRAVGENGAVVVVPIGYSSGHTGAEVDCPVAEREGAEAELAVVVGPCASKAVIVQKSA